MEKGKIVTIDRETMRYMSTGRFRMYYNEKASQLVKEDWRELFRILISKGVEGIDINLDYIVETYKRIYASFENGTFKDGKDILTYFETLPEPENILIDLSHNALLFQSCIEFDDIDSAYQREICSTKVIDVKSGKTWGFAGIYDNMLINKDFFEEHIDGEYLLSHGNSLLGLIAIKEIDKKEFESQKIWFETIHKHPKNTFVKYKKEIENLLRV